MKYDFKVILKCNELCLSVLEVEFDDIFINQNVDFFFKCPVCGRINKIEECFLPNEIIKQKLYNYRKGIKNL